MLIFVDVVIMINSIFFENENEKEKKNFVSVMLGKW